VFIVQAIGADSINILLVQLMAPSNKPVHFEKHAWEHQRDQKFEKKITQFLEM
jgi:hypothetical protein